MGNKKETDLEFAATVLKLQLEDSLSIIGHKILTELEDDVQDLSDEEALQYFKSVMKNPFELIEQSTKELKSEYKEFADSDECREMVEKVLNDLNDDPDVEDVINSIERVTSGNESSINTNSPSKKLQ